MKLSTRIAGALLAGLLLGAGPAAAQPYPSKPIRLLVGAAPGGGTDILARLIGQKLGERLGQQVLVENRPGANFMLATEATARAAPDGYTLAMAATPLATNPSLYADKIRYDTMKDLVWITLATDAPLVLVTHPSVPANSLKELVSLAAAQPGRLSFGSAGTGGSPHLAGVMFEQMAKVKLLHVPYKGLGPALVDLVGGQLQMIFGDITVATPYIKSGKLRALGVTTEKRAASLPDVPTFAEAGLPGYAVHVWYGVFGTGGTPKDVVDRLAREIRVVLAAPDVRERLAALGAEPVGSSPEEFEAFIRAELAKWSKIIRDGNIRAD